MIDTAYPSNQDEARFEEHLAASVRMRQERRSARLSVHFKRNLLAALPARVPGTSTYARRRAGDVLGWLVCVASGVAAALILAGPPLGADIGPALARDIAGVPYDVVTFLADLHATLAATDLVAIALAVLTVIVMSVCRVSLVGYGAVGEPWR